MGISLIFSKKKIFQIKHFTKFIKEFRPQKSIQGQVLAPLVMTNIMCKLIHMHVFHVLNNTGYDLQLVQQPSFGQSYESSTTDRDIPRPN